MNDLISKEKALKAIEAAARLCVADANHNYLMGFQDAAEAVAQVETEAMTEQPERKRGRWMPHEDEDGEHYGDKCSVCGEWYVMPYGKTNFCPACGAYMGEKGGE